MWKASPLTYCSSSCWQLALKRHVWASTDAHHLSSFGIELYHSCRHACKMGLRVRSSHARIQPEGEEPWSWTSLPSIAALLPRAPMHLEPMACNAAMLQE